MAARQQSVRELLRKKAVGELLWHLPTADVDLKRRICAELGRRRPPQAVPDILRTLREARNDGDDRLIEATAEALGRIGDKRAGAALINLLQDETLADGVRDTAAFALARLAYAPATEALLARLADRSRTVRKCALAALAEIGDPAVFGRVALLRSAELDDDVRQAMDHLLDSLSGQSTPYLTLATITAARVANRPLASAPQQVGLAHRALSAWAALAGPLATFSPSPNRHAAGTPISSRNSLARFAIGARSSSMTFDPSSAAGT